MQGVAPTSHLFDPRPCRPNDQNPILPRRRSQLAKLPERGMPADIAYQLIKDMRQLDSNPRLNLASFVTTWMEPEAEKLIQESLNVNFVDVEQYPSCATIERRCVAMLATLFHAPVAEEGKAVGTSGIGSSEAILLAGLAMKKRWTKARKAAGKPFDRPNLIMGANVQVCWHKFTRYWDVEEKLVPVKEDVWVATPKDLVAACDENTIGVVGILGSTYTGAFESIEGIDTAIEKLNKEKGWNIGIHVDGASGAFVAPFLFPDLKWDFRLKNVVSINASGHKYGLVYPGIGWTVWRSPEFLPEEMVFHTNYLGSDQPSFTLNFSKGASMIVAQYYQFLRLGFDGYRRIMTNLQAVAKRMTLALEATGHFKILSTDLSVPLVAFSINKRVDKDGKSHSRTYDEFDLADRLHARGWILPAYNMCKDVQNVSLMRAVIREDMSMSMVDELVSDIKRATDYLDNHFVFSKAQVSAMAMRMHVGTELPDEYYADKHHPAVC
ncbi:hypothetical protein WJX73_003546 [Symbiochloris irregularis]|uniref:Glutamate decarboxylase n=1 Tax=Symbiochloris irregularis TaxID=706552 RepID=A0AAW1NSD6_9CHLO